MGNVIMRRTTIRAHVDDNPTAYLMYYLDCVCNVLRLNDNEDIQRLRKYNEYKNLTHDDRDSLLKFCMSLNPGMLLNNCIFQSDAYCVEFSAEFYALESHEGRQFCINSVIAEEREREISKIMTFKMRWLKEHWLEPMLALIAQQETEKVRMNRKSAWCFCFEHGEANEPEQDEV